MIFDIINNSAPDKLRRDISYYCEQRNKNESYAAKLTIKSNVQNSSQWTKYITGLEVPPHNLPKLDSFKDSFSHFGQSSSTVSAVFSIGYERLAQKIIDISELEAKARQSGYVNLSLQSRALAQLHTSYSGVNLAIREADENVPVCTILKKIDRKKLSGYTGRNKSWLDGDGTYTKSPAAAFHIPGELENEPDHPGWKEVEVLLRYARTK